MSLLPKRESKLRLLPHAQDILTYLRESEITLFVVSNKIGDSLRKEIDLLNLTHFFDNIVGSLDTNFDKPHIAPVNLALKIIVIMIMIKKIFYLLVIL